MIAPIMPPSVAEAGAAWRTLYEAAALDAATIDVDSLASALAVHEGAAALASSGRPALLALLKKAGIEAHRSNQRHGTPARPSEPLNHQHSPRTATPLPPHRASPLPHPRAAISARCRKEASDVSPPRAPGSPRPWPSPPHAPRSRTSTRVHRALGTRTARVRAPRQRRPCSHTATRACTSNA
ncbi:MAG: hypothetical protein CBC48_22065 [bacterium TMED88]|nr:MAG: hypothetical protein CBC48_22065 [bacterium TMED88]